MIGIKGLIKMADEEVYQLSDKHLLEVLMEVDRCVPYTCFNNSQKSY